MGIWRERALKSQQMASIALCVPRAPISPRPCKDYRCTSSKQQRLACGETEHPPFLARAVRKQRDFLDPSAHKGSRAEPSYMR